MNNCDYSYGVARNGRFNLWRGYWLLSAALAFQAFAGAAATNSAVSLETKVRIVLFCPADLDFPPGAAHRLTQAADACDKFYFDWMNHWGYPPAVKSLFVRNASGAAEVLQVRGEDDAASGKYSEPNFADYVMRRAGSQFHLQTNGVVWWIFIYLGDRPARFNDFAGAGNPRIGGWAMVNYDTIAGEIRPELGLSEGFNGEFHLRGTIHELGHAFGLPHIGPDASLGFGNSLMGPTTAEYAKRNLPKPEQAYLPEACAAMLWKHPIFSGTAKDRDVIAKVKLADYKPAYNSTNDTITISGKVETDQPAHSVVLIDDLGGRNEYWKQSHAARITPDGTFKMEINKPAKASGHYRILFCLDNGMVTGDGVHIRFVNRGDIKKSYQFHDGTFQFDGDE